MSADREQLAGVAAPVPLQTLEYRRGENGVAFIRIEVKDRPVNVLTPELHREIGEVAAMLAADAGAIGAVLHSGKPSFLAGGDLKRIVRYYDQGRSPAEAYRQSRTYTESLRRLETCGKPVAVAINGSALGGGLELALACHFRVVADDPAIRLGLPEVTLGLLPGGGGTQRLPRLIGLGKAAPLILSGKHIPPAEALALGLVDRVVPGEQLLAEAEAWVLQAKEATQPWDRPGFRVPGGSGLNDMNTARLFQQLTARTGAEHRHNYPAPIAALRCLFNGTTVGSMDVALKIESREFAALTRDPVARNMIRTLFLNKAQADRADKRFGSGELRRIQRLRLDGEAESCARLRQAIERAGMSAAPEQQADAEPADLAILVAYPGMDLRHALGRLTPAPVVLVMPADAAGAGVGPLYGTGTADPAWLAGLSLPGGEKVAELVVHPDTPEPLRAALADLCRHLCLTPTFQHAAGAALSTRCLEAYRDQKRRMVDEGLDPVLVDNCAWAAGMPRESAAADAPGSAMPARQRPPTETLKRRLLYAQAIAAADFWVAGLVEPADADILSVLGWGFPSYTGGVLSLIDTLGLSEFIARCDALAAEHGAAFRIGEELRARAGQSDRVYPALA